MNVKQFEVWLADLNPQIGTEPGKVRPVIIIQTNLLNSVHPSTIICPLTTKIHAGATILRVFLKKGVAHVTQDCEVLIDQIRSIDNKRLIRKIGELPELQKKQIQDNLRIVLDL